MSKNCEKSKFLWTKTQVTLLSFYGKQKVVKPRVHWMSLLQQLLHREIRKMPRIHIVTISISPKSYLGLKNNWFAVWLYKYGLTGCQLLDMVSMSLEWYQILTPESSDLSELPFIHRDIVCWILNFVDPYHPQNYKNRYPTNKNETTVNKSEK